MRTECSLSPWHHHSRTMCLRCSVASDSCLPCNTPGSGCVWLPHGGLLSVKGNCGLRKVSPRNSAVKRSQNIRRQARIMGTWAGLQIRLDSRDTCVVLRTQFQTSSSCPPCQTSPQCSSSSHRHHADPSPEGGKREAGSVSQSIHKPTCPVAYSRTGFLTEKTIRLLMGTLVPRN